MAKGKKAAKKKVQFCIICGIEEQRAKSKIGRRCSAWRGYHGVQSDEEFSLYVERVELQNVRLSKFHTSFGKKKGKVA